jgi:hypothetical protein
MACRRRYTSKIADLIPLPNTVMFLEQSLEMRDTVLTVDEAVCKRESANFDSAFDPIITICPDEGSGGLGS